MEKALACDLPHRFRGQTMASKEKGFSLVELVFVIAIIGILSTLAVPFIHQARLTAQEKTAVANIRTLFEAQNLYHIRNGKYGTLPELVAESFVPESYEGSGFLGYSFSVVSAGNYHLAIVAVPTEFGISGRKGFFVDETGLIRYSTDGSPPSASSPPLDSSIAS
jgi:prepilin-type N-terminal cleavage/methylation domain-containing protein